MKKLRVRIAPSPTGFMHIGNFRTALYNYLFAKKNNADFVFRIEDTDQKRYVKGAIENLVNTLGWAGITWDEGPIKQSNRLPIYKKYAEELVEKGLAYYCFCEPERLEKMREEQKAQKQPPIYDRYCLKNLSQDEINEKLKSNCSRTIRLKIPENKIIEFTDLVRDKVSFKTDLIDDQILLKSDGYPTYHLANVVDDHEMKITHVIRGEEWLPSTPKHILLYEAFGWEQPKFAHLPLLLNADKSKLSKRQGDVAVEDYINKGYLKEALINFVALLGWNPGEGSTQEIFTLNELIEKFDLAHVHKAGAVFDIKKLDWMNSQWIKKLPSEELYERTLPFLAQKKSYQSWDMEHGTWNKNEKESYIKKFLTVERERLEKLSEVGESNQFFFKDINYDKDLLRWKDASDEESKNNLKKSKDVLNDISENDWNKENLEKFLMDAAGEKPARNATPGVAGGRGELLWPLRASLTGEKKSPSPFEVAWVLGKLESLKRIDDAIKKII